MAPNPRVKTAGRLPPRRNLRTSKAADEEAEHLCQVCFKSFSSAQALGGHKNAHRREREEARNAAAQGTRWVAVSPPPPLMRGCVYNVMGRPQFLYAPPQQRAGGGLVAARGSVTVLESSYVGEESVALPGTSQSTLLFPSSSSSRASEDACTAGRGVPHGCHGADGGEEGPLEDLDLTLHL